MGSESPKTKLLLRFSSFLAAPAALFLGTGQAKAVLTYNIFESGGNVVVQTAGALNLTGATAVATTQCGFDGAIASTLALICTGLSVTSPQYKIAGPSSFNGSALALPASIVTGTTAYLYGTNQAFSISSAYVSGTPIISSATFNGQTLASMGFTITTGLIGTWTLNGTSETIQVVLGQPSAAVPGPLPLLGAGAAFGWSRRLRKRSTTPLSTPPQA